MTQSGASSTRTRRPYAPRLGPEIRREQALDVALGLITDDGVAAVSIEAVASRMNVSKTVLYNLVANTEDLLIALLEREERRAVIQVREFLPFDVAVLNGDPIESTVNGVLMFFDAVRREPGTWRLLVATDGLPDAALKRRREAVDLITHNVASLVAWSMSRRRSGPLDPDLTARTLVAFLETLVHLNLEHPGEYAQERVNDFVRSVLRSVITG